MAALVICISCQFLKCNECEVSNVRKGVMGGWYCVCTHDEKAHARAREKKERTIPFDGEGEFGHWEQVPEEPHVGPGVPVRIPGRQMRWVPKES